jgi:hypothetical protein
MHRQQAGSGRRAGASGLVEQLGSDTMLPVDTSTALGRLQLAIGDAERLGEQLLDLRAKVGRQEVRVGVLATCPALVSLFTWFGCGVDVLPFLP